MVASEGTVTTPPPLLSEGTVQVWCIDFRDCQPHIDFFLNIISPQELARLKRYQFPKDQQRFAIRRGALRMLLGHLLGLPVQDVALEEGRHGKPLLAEQHQSTIRFSISSSGDLALIGMAKSNELGVDIERLRPVADWRQIADRYFAKSESGALRDLPECSGQRRFLEMWTAKEAVAKALGGGLTIPLDQLELSLSCEGGPRLASLGGERHGAGGWRLDCFEPQPGYLAALALPRRPERVLHLRWRLGHEAG